MAFSAVFQFAPGDQQGLNRFLLEHYLEHRAFSKALLAQNPSIPTTDYPIQRIENWETWLGAHQEMSQSVWSALGGGQSTDFSRLKYESPEAVQDWLNYHAQWHTTVREALGL